MNEVIEMVINIYSHILLHFLCETLKKLKVSNSEEVDLFSV